MDLKKLLSTCSFFSSLKKLLNSGILTTIFPNPCLATTPFLQTTQRWRFHLLLGSEMNLCRKSNAGGGKCRNYMGCNSAHLNDNALMLSSVEGRSDVTDKEQ